MMAEYYVTGRGGVAVQYIQYVHVRRVFLLTGGMGLRKERVLPQIFIFIAD